MTGVHVFLKIGDILDLTERREKVIENTNSSTIVTVAEDRVSPSNLLRFSYRVGYDDESTYLRFIDQSTVRPTDSAYIDLRQKMEAVA